MIPVEHKAQDTLKSVWCVPFRVQFPGPYLEAVQQHRDIALEIRDCFSSQDVERNWPISTYKTY